MRVHEYVKTYYHGSKYQKRQGERTRRLVLASIFSLFAKGEEELTRDRIYNEYLDCCQSEKVKPVGRNSVSGYVRTIAKTFDFLNERPVSLGRQGYRCMLCFNGKE